MNKSKIDPKNVNELWKEISKLIGWKDIVPVIIQFYPSITSHAIGILMSSNVNHIVNLRLALQNNNAT